MTRDGGPRRAARRLRRLAAKGPSGVTRALAARLPRIWIDELHVWSFVPLAGSRQTLSLPAGVTGRIASPEDVEALPDWAGTPVDVRSRMAAGHELFIGLAQRISGSLEIVFTGWAFHGQAPTIAAPGGSVPLPAGVVNIEDTKTAPAWRGRGVAPALYGHLFNYLEGAGASLIVGKVESHNAANRRALAKSGWTDFAEVRFRRLGPWSRAQVRTIGDSPTQREWADHLRATFSAT